MTSVKIISLIFFIICSAFIFSCTNEADTQNVDKVPERQHEPLYYFDHTVIDIEKTDGLDLRFKNLNLVLDMYGNLILMGEIENKSPIAKQDITLTFDFFGSHGQNIFSMEKRSKIRYLLSGQTKPFRQIVDEKDRYIDIDAVKVGVNFKNYNDRPRGNAVVEQERFYYNGRYLVIEGQVANLGMRKIEDIVLLATFYDYQNRVVFIRECYLPLNELGPQERQPYELKILLDPYLPDFTSYSFSVFFKDTISIEPELDLDDEIG